jgi:hypothetical protein
MFKHVCPECGKNSYSADETCFSACPYCRCRFSGTYGPDRRRGERFTINTDISVRHHERLLQATLTDLSETGLGVKIFGETPFASGESVELSTGSIHIKAMVMWMTKLNDESVAGLQRLMNKRISDRRE